jgi:hypothetical protein
MLELQNKVFAPDPSVKDDEGKDAIDLARGFSDVDDIFRLLESWERR